MSTPTTTPNPFAMPMDDLAKAAGVGQPAAPEPVAAPAPVPAAPAPVVPEAYTLQQDDNGVTITLAPEFGGEVFKGKDLTEVLPKLAKAKADANAYIKQLKTQPAPAVEPAKPAVPAEDPAEVATREWILEQSAKALGMSVAEYKARVSMVFETTEQMQTNLAVADFHKACPDYVDTPENSAALSSYFPDNFGRFPTAQELRQAYALALLDNKITKAIPAVAQPKPLPMPGGGTSTVSAAGNPWTMDMDQLAQAAGIK